MNVTGKPAAALIIAAISFAGCKNKPMYVMTMTMAKEGEVMFWLTGTGTAVIDWGDGSAPETVALLAVDGDVWSYPPYRHTFSDTTTRTIVIKGQNITRMICGSMQLTALDVSKYPFPENTQVSIIC